MSKRRADFAIFNNSMKGFTKQNIPYEYSCCFIRHIFWYLSYLLIYPSNMLEPHPSDEPTQALLLALLDLWQFVARPAAAGRLDVVLPDITRILGRALPVTALELLIPDAGNQQLRGWRCEAADETRSSRCPLPAAELSALTSWCAASTIETTNGRSRPRWLKALPTLSASRADLVSGAGPMAALGLAGSAGEHSALALLHLRAGAGIGPGLRGCLARIAAGLRTLLDWQDVRSELSGLHELVSQLRDREPVRSTETIVGADGGLRPVLERVRMVAATDVPVLILGETGSGKEVIARAIHQGSPRTGQAFVRVNCGALPPDLIDTELFGHERGAFTGAAAARRGWFEQADRGTLFLDEIGELPLAAQVRLLRVLQDGTLNRIGSETPLHVNVRVVAATHRDLPSMVLAGRFREDLWYRLATFPVLLPPLRERKADFADLAAHFARRAAHRFGFPVVQPTGTDVALLSAYDWPGNVREFAAVIDRALLLGEGRSLDVATALGAPRVQALQPVAAGMPPSPVPAVGATGTLVTLDEAMRSHIARALEMTHGRLEGRHGAALLLGINPHTLRARMRKLGLDPAQFRPH